MKQFKEYQAQFPKPIRIVPEYKWYGYKDGVTYEFPDQESARNFTSLVERVIANKEEIEQNHNTIVGAENQASQAWYNDLRKEYYYFNDTQFNLVYNMAYERGHSSGYDEVANYMIDLSTFADALLQTVPGYKIVD